MLVEMKNLVSRDETLKSTDKVWGTKTNEDRSRTPVITRQSGQPHPEKTMATEPFCVWGRIAAGHVYASGQQTAKYEQRWV